MSFFVPIWHGYYAGYLLFKQAAANGNRCLIGLFFPHINCAVVIAALRFVPGFFELAWLASNYAFVLVFVYVGLACSSWCLLYAAHVQVHRLSLMHSCVHSLIYLAAPLLQCEKICNWTNMNYNNKTKCIRCIPAYTVWIMPNKKYGWWWHCLCEVCSWAKTMEWGVT